MKKTKPRREEGGGGGNGNGRKTSTNIGNEGTVESFNGGGYGASNA